MRQNFQFHVKNVRNSKCITNKAYVTRKKIIFIISKLVNGISIGYIH